MSDPSLCQPTTFDLFAKGAQVLSWLVASVGGLIMAYRAVAEFRIANDLRARDIRARLAERAKQEVDGLFADPRVEAALTLVDVDGASFALVPPGEKDAKVENLSHEALRHALRTMDLRLTPLELSVRSAFDALFMRLASIAVLSTLNIIKLEDVSPPLSYHIRQLSKFKAEVLAYCNKFGFPEALQFLRNMPEWSHPDVPADR